MAQYEHRKLMMKVNQQLGSEEFDSLVYLMCVPDEIVEATQSDHNRTCVLRYLEKQNIIGPHNYHCLVDALDTLGRCDLIMQIASADPEGVVAKLPYTPQSIQPQQLAWLAKRETILGRKEKYEGCMKSLYALMHSQQAAESIYNALFSRLLSMLTYKQVQISPQCQESVAAALTELSLFWKRWPTTIATIMYDGDSCKVKTLISDCHSCFDRFNHELPTDWEMEVREHVIYQRSKVDYPIRELALEAHSTLHELSAELVGEQALKEASKRTKESLFTLANYTAQYMHPIYKWLMTLVYSTALSATASKMYATLKVIVSDHCDDIARNKDTLLKVCGEEFMDRISQEFLQDKARDSDMKQDVDSSTLTTIISSFSLVWHVALVMLTMMSLNYEIDNRAIQQKLVDYLATQKGCTMQAYVQVSNKMAEKMHKEVDYYKEICEQKTSQLLGGTHEPPEIVRSLFCYKTS